MATSSQDARKRKSLSSERNESRKRRKEDDKSKTKRSKSRRSGRDDTAAERKKFKSITELVKLVIAGEVAVPKGLKHCASDRNQLLDQVFTILSERDVKGMLPDILKGLKIKHIRQLCLEQLKGMTEEDIAESLEDTQTSVESLNVDATVLKFLGSEATGEDGVRRDEAERGKDHRGDTATKIDLDGGGDLEKNRGSLLVCEEKQQQSVVCVSDVSEDEGTVASSTVDVASQEGPLTRSSPTLTMECDTTTTELSTDPHTRSEREEGLSEREGEGLSDRDEERPSEREGEGEIDSEDGTSTGSDSSLSDLEDCWLCDFPDEVSEMARLREIEFRQRALEAELRRRGETVDTHTGDGDRGKKEEGEEGERVSVCDGGERDGVSDTFSQDATAKLDKSKAIEMQLRQRALQSLLAKKKQQNL